MRGFFFFLRIKLDQSWSSGSSSSTRNLVLRKISIGWGQAKAFLLCLYTCLQAEQWLWWLRRSKIVVGSLPDHSSKRREAGLAVGTDARSTPQANSPWNSELNHHHHQSPGAATSPRGPGRCAMQPRQLAVVILAHGPQLMRHQHHWLLLASSTGAVSCPTLLMYLNLPVRQLQLRKKINAFVNHW